MCLLQQAIDLQFLNIQETKKTLENKSRTYWRCSLGEEFLQELQSSKSEENYRIPWGGGGGGSKNKNQEDR